MSSRFLILISTIILYIISFFTPLLAATKSQVASHFSVQTTQQKKSQRKSCICAFREYACPNLKIGPIDSYFNVRRTLNDPSELIVNIPAIREDASILVRQYQLERECQELGISVPSFPQVTFSGKLEGQLVYGSYSGFKTSNIDFSSVELNTYVRGNPWVSGYMALNYDSNNDSLSNGRSPVFLDRAFIAIGDLNQLPVYISIGQVYIPFGHYSSLMITTPVTLELGRIRSQAITIGYQKTDDNALHAELLVYKGLTNNLLHGNKRNQWGIDFGYKFSTGSRVNSEIGASLVSNLADSQGMQAAAFSSSLLPGKILHHAVQAIDLYGNFTINPMTFTAEYVGALSSFDISDISFKGRGACPSAFHTEANYALRSVDSRSSIGISYDHTAQAMMLGFPQDRYSIFCNIGIWKDTNFALEYRHDTNYSTKITSSVNGGIKNSIPASIIIGANKNDNVITARFDLYF
ncbi:LbtU family siderophore porin [Coxiella-like endosymbiont of Amblyomma americanum]